MTYQAIPTDKLSEWRDDANRMVTLMGAVVNDDISNVMNRLVNDLNQAITFAPEVEVES